MDRALDIRECWGARAVPGAAALRARAGVFLLLTLVLLAAAPAGAADVTSAGVTGHKSVSTRDILAVLGLIEGAAFDADVVDAGVDSLVALYAGLARPFAHVNVAWDSTAAGVEVGVLIDEGPEILLAGLEFRTAGAPVPSELARSLDLLPGKRLTRRSLAGDVDALLRGYADGGLPFAEIVMPPTVTLSDDGGLTGSIEIREGLSAWFGSVVVAGNKVTRERVIAREAGLVRGELFSESRLAGVRPRLERLAYLDAVDEPVVAVDPGTGETTVGIKVTEGTANRISGVLGLSGGQGTADELTGMVDIELGNIAGTGRSAAAAWQRIRESQTEISFAYTEPWLLGSPIDIGVAGRQSVRDTFYTTVEGDLLVTARVGDRVRLTWSVGAERYVPGSADESTTTSARTAFAAAYDGADAPWNPTSGTRLSVGVGYAAKEILDSGRKERSGTVVAEAEGFLRVVARQVLALRGRVEVLASSEASVPTHELLVLGGARSLRGYREEQFRGTTVALASIEYRLLLGRRSRAIAFVDVGHWEREGANPAKDTNLGYGIGLRGDTRLGTISIDYGLGEGDDLLDGKLHAGLIREF